MKIQRAILAWSEDDINGWREGDVVVPLSAEAHIAALRLPATTTLDPKPLIGDPAEIRASSCDVLNMLHENLKLSRFPWFEAYANVIFHTKVFQLIAWLKLMRSLQVMLRPTTLEICRPWRLGDDSFIERLARLSFGLACEAVQDEGVLVCSHGLRPSDTSSPWKVRLLRSRALRPALIGTASLSLRSHHFRGREAADSDSSLRPADVVLVSAQF